MLNTISKTRLLFLVGAAGILVGACADHLLVNLQANRAADTKMTISNAWIKAARGCWTGFDMWHDQNIAEALADPSHFRAVFIGYRFLPDSELKKIAVEPPSSKSPPELFAIYGGRPDTVNLPASGDEVVILDQKPILLQKEEVSNESVGPDTPTAKVAPTLCSVAEGIPPGLQLK